MVAHAAAAGEVTLEEFKARLPLVEVVGRYVRLTRAGREHRGLCPFHKEKSPSFHVVGEKGFYHCFGCGAHGNAIDFVMGVEGLEFGAAIERVAEITGLQPPRRAKGGGGGEAEDAQQKALDRLRAANAAAAAWFARTLAGEPGADARAYLERRGVDRQTAQVFGLGYAPDDRGALKRALNEQGYAEAELVDAGLVAVPDGGGPAYDRFRHRLMFPIHDERGRAVGFGGRALAEAARAKYLNTPDTALFHKGELLYNLARAAPAARERRALVLAEGYMDVIALHRAGSPNAVAPLGTAVTERQLQLAWRYAEAPVVCLDGDRAGLAAALRAAERALPLMRGERTLRFALLPEGDDPDSFVARHGGAAMAEVLAKAQPLSETLWRLLTEGREFGTAEAQAGLRRRLRAYTGLAADPDLRASLDAAFRQRLDAAFAPRRWQGRGGNAPRGPRPPPAPGGGASPSGRAPGGGGGWAQPAPAEGRVGASELAAGLRAFDGMMGEYLLGPVLRDPGLLDGREEAFAAAPMPPGEFDRLRQEIILWFCDHPALDGTALAQHLHGRGLASARERVLATVARVARLRGETAWPSAEEWDATLAQQRQASARRDQRASFVESVLGGKASDVAVNRTSFDRLLNVRPAEAPGIAPPDPARKEDKV